MPEEQTGQDAGTQGAAPAATSTPTGDYDARLSADPTFAAAEAKKNQSRADRAEASNRELVGQLGGEDSALMRLVKQYGPDVVAQATNNYATLRSHEKLGSVVTGFESTGQITFGPNGADNADTDDEYLSPEEKKIKELEAELASVRSQVGSLATSTGTAALQGHLEKFASEYLLNPEEFGKVKEGIMAQVKTWGATDQGRQILQNLQNADGYATVKALGLSHTPNSALEALGERKRLRKEGRLEGFRTDGPTDTSTTGDEGMPEVKGALEALRAAEANPEKLKRLYPEYD